MGLSVLQSSFAAHLLGVSGLGVLGTITGFASTINRLFSFRMGELVIKYVGDYLAKNRQDRAAAIIKTAFIVEAASSILAFALLVLLSPLAARYLADDPTTAPLFLLYGLIIFGNIITETSVGILHIDNQFRNQAIVNLSQGILTAGIIIWAFFTGRGLTTVLIAYLLGKMILGMGPTVLAMGSLNRILGAGWWRASFDLLPPWRELARFGLGTNFSATVNLLVRDSEVLWVAFFLSPLEAGYYKVALAINNFILMPITPFISTTYPEINRSVAMRKWTQLRKLLKQITVFSLAWTLIAALVLAVLGKWLIPIYAGVEFLPAYPAMLVLLIGCGTANIFFWSRVLLLSFGKAVYAFQAMLWCGLGKMLLAFLLVPRFGYVAEAGLLSAYFICSVGLIVWKGFRELRQAETVLAVEAEV